MDKKKQLETIKASLSVCKTPSERRTVFLAYVLDMSFHRDALCQALKELKIKDDMTVENRI